MTEERRAVFIFSTSSFLFMEKCDNYYSFPSVIIEGNENPQKSFINKYHWDEYKSYYWRTMEYWDYARDTKILLKCYIVDCSEASSLFNRLTKITKTDLNTSKIIDEHRQLVEFFLAIPNNEYLYNSNELFGQVFLNDDSIRVSITNKKLLQMELNSLEGDTYFPLYFYEFNSYKIIHVRSGDFERQEGQLYSVKFVQPEEIQKGEYEGYLATAEGEVCFASSPIVSRDRWGIVIKRNDNDEISKLYSSLFDVWKKRTYAKTIRDFNTIHSKLYKDYSIIAPQIVEARIYNVGQANCCYCDMQDRKAFFDVGVTKCSSEINASNRSIWRAVNYDIPFLDVDDVFITHWDLDHYLGVAYNSNCLHGKRWIAPDMKILQDQHGETIDLSLIRLLNYLILVGKSEVLLIDTCSHCHDKIECTMLSVYCGYPMKTKRNKSIYNNGGLIYKIQNRENLLMTGDCDYTCMSPAVISKEYDNVIIPHHGSELGNPSLKGKPNKYNSAYICIGKKTGNFRVDKQIRKKYSGCGFKYISRTKNLRTNSHFKLYL